MENYSGEGASHSVYRGILQALDAGTMVAGQRLVESELAEQFSVGRNAVREALHCLAAGGVVNLNRNRSASIRQIDAEEADEVFDVSGAMSELLFGLAAAHYNAKEHEEELQAALDEVKSAYADGREFIFSHARRELYRVVLKIANNRELNRIFPAIGIHILNAKYQSRKLQSIRIRNYQKIVTAIMEGNVKRARTLAVRHNEQMRLAMREHADLRDRA